MVWRTHFQKVTLGALVIASFLWAGGAVSVAAQTSQKPNILVIMGDDIGRVIFRYLAENALKHPSKALSSGRHHPLRARALCFG